MKIIVIIMFSLLSLGCTVWPQEGSGGIGELRPTKIKSEAARALRYESIALEEALYRLELLGAKTCMPGRMKILRKKIQGSQRELYANMLDDSAFHMFLIKGEIHDIECRLAQMKEISTCTTNKSFHL